MHHHADIGWIVWTLAAFVGAIIAGLAWLAREIAGDIDEMNDGD